jgi:hypothetical protein
MRLRRVRRKPRIRLGSRQEVQALVELTPLAPLLLLVVRIVQFEVALDDWLDVQRRANRASARQGKMAGAC